MTSDSIEKITEALIQFHDAVQPLQKNSESTAGTRAYRYADLAAVWDTIRQPLVSAGLVLIQTLEPMDLVKCTETTQAWALLRTRLYHRSGQWVDSVLPIVADWSNPQRMGSALTYGRRYAVLGLLGLAPEDDDGLAAQAAPQRREDRRPVPRRDNPPPRPAHEERFEDAVPVSVNGHGNGRREPTEDEVLDRIAGQEGVPYEPAPPRQPRLAPRTGLQLYQYATTSRIDPALTRWILERFEPLKFPHRFKDWTDSQVARAWPEIREHLKAMKAARNGAAV